MPSLKSDHLLQEGRDPRMESSARRAGRIVELPRRIAVRILHELSGALPPTIFFFVGFNFIVLTTNLLVADYGAAVSNFMLATVAALVVGKAVITANAAPLIHPILFKAGVYWVAVFFARLAERFVHYSVVDGNRPGDFPGYLISSFSWHRFTAISLWILALFLIYETASELTQLLGPTEMR